MWANLTIEDAKGDRPYCLGPPGFGFDQWTTRDAGSIGTATITEEVG